mgnify:CR=1 FL=1
MDNALVDSIRASFASQGLMGTFDAEIIEISKGRVQIAMPITAAVGQQHGVAQAGARFAIGDSACGYAALSMMPQGAEVMTVEMKINLIAPADGLRLIATGEVVKPGRRLVLTRGTVAVERADGTQREVALLQGTMIPV